MSPVGDAALLHQFLPKAAVKGGDRVEARFSGNGGQDGVSKRGNGLWPTLEDEPPVDVEFRSHAWHFQQLADRRRYISRVCFIELCENKDRLYDDDRVENQRVLAVRGVPLS